MTNDALHATGSPAMRLVSPCVDPDWARLVDDRQAGLFHSPPWLRALADAFGLDPRAWIAADGTGTPVGGVAFCDLDDLGGRRRVCLPFSDCADPLFASPDVREELVARLRSAQVPVQLRCLFEERLRPEEGWSILHQAPWHRIAVADSEAEIWRRIAPPARRCIRRAQRSGMEIRALRGDADRADFHRLHVALRKRKYRLLAQPPEFLEALERRFDEAQGWHALAAVLDGRTIAGTIYLRWGDVLYYKFNASEFDALGVRPNHLLVWEGLLLARRLGCATLDLGPSRPDQPGLVRFKRSFGAEEARLRFLAWTPPGWRQAAAAGRGPLAELVDALTSPDLPDEVAARAGAALYRFLA